MRPPAAQLLHLGMNTVVTPLVVTKLAQLVHVFRRFSVYKN